MSGVFWRQIGGVLRLELKKTFLSKRGWWIYVLALGPLAVVLIHWAVESRSHSGPGHHSLGEDSLIFAAMFIFGLAATSRSSFEAHLPRYTGGVTAAQIAASGKTNSSSPGGTCAVMYSAESSMPRPIAPLQRQPANAGARSA